MFVQSEPPVAMMKLNHVTIYCRETIRNDAFVFTVIPSVIEQYSASVQILSL